MTVPAEAIDAAAQAICDDDCLTPPCAPTNVDRRVARKAVEAAAPLIAADVLARVEQGIADGAAEAIAQVVAAERERIRQLALLQATAPLSAQSPIASQALREFADLLAGDQP